MNDQNIKDVIAFAKAAITEYENAGNFERQLPERVFSIGSRLFYAGQNLCSHAGYKLEPVDNAHYAALENGAKLFEKGKGA